MFELSSLRLAVMLFAGLSVGCGAADAGTYCEQDYHCISGSCTWRTCDAFPSCWPTCGDDDDTRVEPQRPPGDVSRPWIDAGQCAPLRLCSELSLSECDLELGCWRSTVCAPDARVSVPWTAGPWSTSTLDAGTSASCAGEQRCVAIGGTDIRVHPLNAMRCF